jgi:ATP-dependent Clp protease adaptor protein ClpS
MDATKIMLHVHKNGKGNVGSFTYDVATTKVNQAHKMARERQYPLKCTIEKE